MWDILGPLEDRWILFWKNFLPPFHLNFTQKWSSGYHQNRSDTIMLAWEIRRCLSTHTVGEKMFCLFPVGRLVLLYHVVTAHIKVVMQRKIYSLQSNILQMFSRKPFGTSIELNLMEVTECIQTIRKRSKNECKESLSLFLRILFKVRTVLKGALPKSYRIQRSSIFVPYKIRLLLHSLYNVMSK